MVDFIKKNSLLFSNKAFKFRIKTTVKVIFSQILNAGFQKQFTRNFSWNQWHELESFFSFISRYYLRYISRNKANRSPKSCRRSTYYYRPHHQLPRFICSVDQPSWTTRPARQRWNSVYAYHTYRYRCTNSDIVILDRSARRFDDRCQHGGRQLRGYYCILFLNDLLLPEHSDHGSPRTPFVYYL